MLSQPFPSHSVMKWCSNPTIYYRLDMFGAEHAHLTPPPPMRALISMSRGPLLVALSSTWNTPSLKPSNCNSAHARMHKHAIDDVDGIDVHKR
jgi:hypothetical protein